MAKCNILWAVVLMAAAGGCACRLNSNGWDVTADANKKTVTIKRKGLGLIVKDAHLAVREDGRICKLSEWSVRADKDTLSISTREPKSTKWEFKTTDKELDISCSDDDGVVKGTAAATEERIPARLKDQDNGVIYTSLGFVSAGNIHSLFDRKTDIMIQFPKESELRRNACNNKAMDVTIPIGEGAEISLIPDYYTEEIGLARYQKTKFKPVYRPMPQRFKRAPVGWSSWYCYYMNPTEQDIMKEADVLARLLKPYGMEYVQLDACYTRGEEANWLEWYKKLFPSGGKQLFQYIKSKGLKPGLWLNAYGANYAKPACADKYREEFFLRDKNGQLSQACCTADNTVVKLDYTNPEVFEKHLKPLFRTLVNDWGLKYLKSAGWGAWMDYYEKNKVNAFDGSQDSREIYRKVQSVIRDIMGPDNYITGCAMHEFGIGFDIFDGSRVGADDAAVWHPRRKGGMSMQTYFDSLFGANYLNGIVWWSYPDDVMVRPPLTLDEARTIVSSIALSGQTYIVSDFMGKLSKQKLELYKKTMPTMPITAIDLYPFKSEPICCPRPDERPKALVLKVDAESGVYDVVAIYNWSDAGDFKEISFAEDLGLCGDKKYLIFDFWNEQLEGVFENKIEVEVPTHGVRVLVIRALLDRPQLLATSRHITGAFSITKLGWNSSEFTLSGTSATIPDTPYSLFVYVPAGTTLSKVDSNADVLFHKSDNGLLEVAFQGQEEPVNWKLKFLR